MQRIFCLGSVVWTSLPCCYSPGPETRCALVISARNPVLLANELRGSTRARVGSGRAAELRVLLPWCERSLARASARATVVCACVRWLKASPRARGRAGLWRSELHRANEVSISVWRTGEDTTWQLLVPGVWSLLAGAGGAPGDTGISSCSEKAVESGDGETQEPGQQMDSFLGRCPKGTEQGRACLSWRLRCMESFIDPLMKGAVFADQLVRTGLSDLLLTDPVPTSFSGFVNVRRQFKRPKAACLLLQAFLMWEFVSAQQTFIFHALFCWAGAGGLMPCWRCATDLLHPDVALRKSSSKLLVCGACSSPQLSENGMILGHSLRAPGYKNHPVLHWSSSSSMSWVLHLVSSSGTSLLVKMNLPEASGFQEKTSNRNSYTDELVALICNSTLNGFGLGRAESLPGLESWLFTCCSLRARPEDRFSFPGGMVLMPVI